MSARDHRPTPHSKRRPPFRVHCSPAFRRRGRRRMRARGASRASGWSKPTPQPTTMTFRCDDATRSLDTHYAVLVVSSPPARVAAEQWVRSPYGKRVQSERPSSCAPSRRVSRGRAQRFIMQHNGRERSSAGSARPRPRDGPPIFSFVVVSVTAARLGSSFGGRRILTATTGGRRLRGDLPRWRSSCFE